MHKVVADYTQESSNNNIKVFVRARPLEEDTNDSTDFITVSEEDERRISIRDPAAGSNKKYGEVSFQFDRVFWTNASQVDVFNDVNRNQIDYVLNGYNCCCFACMKYIIL